MVGNCGGLDSWQQSLVDSQQENGASVMQLQENQLYQTWAGLEMDPSLVKPPEGKEWSSASTLISASWGPQERIQPSHAWTSDPWKLR